GRIPPRPQEPGRPGEGVEAANLAQADPLEGQPDRPRLSPVTEVLVHAVRHRREPEAPGPMEAHRLAGLRLEPPVEIRAGEVDPRQVQARVEVRRVAGRVPRRA